MSSNEVPHRADPVPFTVKQVPIWTTQVPTSTKEVPISRTHVPDTPSEGLRALPYFGGISQLSNTDSSSGSTSLNSMAMR
jgi:hypothetical protein